MAKVNENNRTMIFGAILLGLFCGSSFGFDRWGEELSPRLRVNYLSQKSGRKIRMKFACFCLGNRGVVDLDSLRSWRGRFVE